eukprot:CAMPEP_0171896426 /NCGR_PEP_ID=MMETSP0992-20121227/47568_1 /TAXON_ID=483369 /ORGANISM="non described non described, Strain CCMP2098" /LENGTH=428 /DNA_ID=CAMNT_0012524431 /DNA_START=78 /DNA_END=1364 /DNA_ORIENTATION=-
MDDMLTSDTKNGNQGAAATSAVDTLTTTAVTQTAAAADVTAQSTPLVNSAVTAAAANTAAPAAAAANTVAPAAAGNTAAPDAAANTVPDAATTQSAAEDSKTLGSELHAKFIAAADLSYDTPSGPAKALSMQAFKKLVTSSSSAETQEWPQLSSKPKDEDLEAAFSLADTDGNKAVDEGEFVALLSLIRKGEVEGLGKKSFFGPDKKRQASFAGHLKLELPAAAAKAAAAKEAHEAAEAEAALKFAGLADFLKAEGLAWSLMAFVNAGKQTTESVVALDETALAARPFDMKPAHVIKIKRAGTIWKAAKQTVKNEEAAEAAAKARESEERLAAQSAAEASAATSSRTEEAAPSRKEESDNIFLFAFALFIVLCTLCYFVGTGTIDLGFDSAAAAKAAAVEKAEKAMAEAAASAKACKGLGKLLGKCKK